MFFGGKAMKMQCMCTLNPNDIMYKDINSQLRLIKFGLSFGKCYIMANLTDGIRM